MFNIHKRKEKRSLTPEEAKRRIRIYGTALTVMIFIIIIAPKHGKEQEKRTEDIAFVTQHMDALLDSVKLTILGDSVTVREAEKPEKTMISCSEKEQLSAMRTIADAMKDRMYSKLIEKEADSLCRIIAMKPDIGGWVRKIRLTLPDGRKVFGFQTCDNEFRKSKLKYLTVEKDTASVNTELKKIQESLNPYIEK